MPLQRIAAGVLSAEKRRDTRLIAAAYLPVPAHESGTDAFRYGDGLRYGRERSGVQSIGNYQALMLLNMFSRCADALRDDGITLFAQKGMPIPSILLQVGRRENKGFQPGAVPGIFLGSCLRQIRQFSVLFFREQGVDDVSCP